MAFNFNGNTPKKILYNGLNVAKLIYNGVVVWMSKVLTAIEGILPLTLTNCTGDDLVGYKIYGNTEEVLPRGYTRVEYLESTGTQYIDIGRKMYNNSEIELCFSFNEMQQNCSIFGSRANSTTNNFEIASVSSSFPIYLDFGNYNTSRATYNNAVINTKYICTISKSLRAVYDENRTLLASNTTLISADNATPSNARIFDTAGGYSQNKLKGKVYYCKIWEDGVLIRDMIPCKNSSNVAGLYDTVNGAFYTNAGTGTFNTGSVVSKKSVGDLVTDTSDINYGKYKIPVLTNSHTTNIYLNKPLRRVSKLPYGYTEIEHIRSTGTQYIDTGVSAKNTVGFKIDYQSTNIDQIGVQIGARNNNNVRQWINDNQNILYIGFGGLIELGTPSLERRTVSLNYLNSRVTTDSLTSAQANLSAITDTNLNIYIFAANFSNKYCFTGKLFSAQITDGTTIVRNFIPCKNSSNVVGMYDTVNDVFYTNAGSGSFIAGAEVETVYYTDYLDYENQKVVRNVDDNDKGIDTSIEESVVLPAVPTDEGTTVFDVDTDVTPSYAEVKYYTKPIIENKTLKTSDNLVFITSDNKIFKLKEEE